jgi:hypothetical protein
MEPGLELVHQNSPFKGLLNKKTLRQSLLFLGITDGEMRYRKGARTIMESWTGEAETLLDLVKKRWKEKVKIHHEATGNNPDAWREYNVAYSTAIKKIAPFLKRILDRKLIIFECIICKREFAKKCFNPFQFNSKLCRRVECKREYYRLRALRERAKKKRNFRKICENPECQESFITRFSVQKYCSKKCFKKHYRMLHPEQLSESSKEKRRVGDRARYASLSEEERAEFVERKLQKRREREEKLSEDKKMLLKNKKREYMLKYIQRSPKKKQLQGKAWLEAKRIKYIDKPWIYETILQKYTEQQKRYTEKRKIRKLNKKI